MSEVSKLTTALLNDPSKEHINLKFFLGDNRNVTMEEIARECLLAIEQEAKGLLQRNNDLDIALQSKKITDLPL